MKNITDSDLSTIEAGNFAYDVGRLIRFVSIAGPTGTFIGLAIGDWLGTDAETELALNLAT